MKEDNNTLANCYFLLQGIGTLISWNAILNGLDYFTSQFLGIDIPFLFPIAVFVAQGVANLGILQISKAISFHKRVITPLVVLGIILFILPIVTNNVAQTTSGFWIVMMLLFFVGFCGTVYQSSLSGLLSFFPGKYTSHFLSGTGFAGLVMNALRAIAIIVFEEKSSVPAPSDTDNSFKEIIFYFSIASLIMITCIIIHVVFTKTEFYLAHAKLVDGKVSDSVSPSGDSEAGNSLIEGENQSMIGALLAVFKEVRFFVLILLVNYIQTFIFYPGIMLKKPVSLTFDWKLVTMTTVFNIFDIVGKSVAQKREKYNKNILLKALLSRFIFFVTFFMQALTDIPVINTLWFGYFNIALFAFTNGFVTTASFIMAPENVEGKKKEFAGFLSMSGLTTGIMLGTFCAFPFRNI